MRVCLSCGILDFRTALNAIPPDLIDWWMAFDSLTGAITGRDADHRSAVGTAFSLNLHKSDESPDVEVAQVLAAFGEHGFQESFADLQRLIRDQSTTDDYETAAEREIARIPKHPNA